MPLRYSKYISLIHFVGDLIIINVSFLLSYFIKFDNLLTFGDTKYPQLLIIFNVVWLVLNLVGKPYNIYRTTRVAKIVRRYISFVLLHLLIISSIWVVFQAYFFSRVQLFATYAMFFFLLLAWKIIFAYVLRMYRKKGFNFRRVVVVGHGDIAVELLKFFKIHPEFGFKFMGFFDNKRSGENILGKFQDVQQFAKENDIDEIYCCLPYVRYSEIKKIVDFGHENLIKVKLISDFRGFSLNGLELQRYDSIPVLNVTSTPLEEVKNKFVKRTFDVLFSSLVIILFLSWMVPLIALLVAVTSRGPIFFRQKRTGLNNESFWCYKFRSMYVNSDADQKQASKNDDRITWIGRILRKTSLDELPQFFNVLVGDMSVVGPRPHMLKHTEEYSKVIEKFMSRHFVKPGITGLAQAKGYRGETHSLVLMKNRVTFDKFYVANWSLVLDVKIILLTVLSMIKKNENAF